MESLLPTNQKWKNVNSVFFDLLIAYPGWSPIESHRWIMGISEKSIDGSLNVPLPFNAGHGKIIEKINEIVMISSGS